MARLGEIFAAFLRLGFTSFGGPVAHIGYFRREFVRHRAWLGEAAYADLVGLCQLLPGPTSSQVGFLLGVQRGGSVWGGLAAWLGFTLPSAFFLVVCSYAQTALSGPVAAGLLHGLQLVTVAVVAQALWGMVSSLAPDFERRFIALVAAGAALLAEGPFGPPAVILLGACAGYFFCHKTESSVSTPLKSGVTRRQGIAALILMAIFLLLPAIAGANAGVALFSAFYRAGALVFGGGHVVLPVLQGFVVAPGWMSDATFLTGYGLAQAVPGPLFSLAAYLGAVRLPAPHGLAGGALALIGIFLPGLLLAYGALPFREMLRRTEGAEAASRGINAAVVGILAAAFCNPVCTTGIGTVTDAVFAMAGFLLLNFLRVPSILVIVLLVAAGMLRGMI